MRHFKRSLSIALLLLFGFSGMVYAQQDKSTAKVDSSYQSYISDAWDKFSNADEAQERDSLQAKYSKEFYVYYQQNPGTKTGKDALVSAFMMWGNTGIDTHLDEALKSLDYDSEVWGKIVISMANLYHRNEERDIKDYYKMMWDLKEKLTDPESKSAVILSLLRKNMREGKKAAKKLASQLVELDAAEFYVQQGKGYLHELESLNVGQKAPDFTVKKMNGKKVSLSELEGQYVLLDFWATWCGPCIPEIPHLKTLWEEHQDDNFQLISVSFDRDKKKLKEFIKEKNIKWPQVYQPKGWDSEIAALYNVTGIPHTYFIGPEGEIIAKDLRGEKMVEEIGKHLSK